MSSGNAGWWQQVVVSSLALVALLDLSLTPGTPVLIVFYALNESEKGRSFSLDLNELMHAWSFWSIFRAGAFTKLHNCNNHF